MIKIENETQYRRAVERVDELHYSDKHFALNL